MIRIMLVDDQVLFVESLKNIIEMRSKDIVVVAVAYDGQQAIALVDTTKPDIVLMDVRMPGVDGVEATRLIHERHPEVKIMMLTTFDDDDYVREALNNGAVGYLLKTSKPSELMASVRAISGGIFQISPTVAARLLRETRSDKSAGSDVMNGRHGKPAWYGYLSHREKEILKYVLEGLSNRQISDTLYLAEQTVKNHLSVVYSKLDAHSRSQVIRKLVEAGIDLSHY